MAKTFTWVTAAILLFLGLSGLIPPLVYSPAPQDTRPTDVSAGHFHPGLLYNVFPTNLLLSGLFILLGGLGIVASLSPRNARVYVRGLFFLSVVLMFCALIPGLSTMFGFLPLGGWTAAIWFILMLAVFYPAFLDGPLMKTINEPVFRQPS